MSPAVLAAVTRNGIVESVHHGSAVVLDANGDVEFAVGDIRAPIYGRSSNKPMQGVAMLELGADLDGEQLAIAVASHSGSALHQATAASILLDRGLSVDALQCVVDVPYGQPDLHAFWAAGAQPSRLVMNCSGKHAAMVCTCVRNGWDPQQYLDPTGPLTQHVTATITRLTGEPPSHIGVDGCGAPAHVVTVEGLARAFRTICGAPSGTPEHRVATAMRTHPHLVGGAGRDDTILMPAVPGLISKEGAEGIGVAALPDGRAVAMKLADGTARGRLAVMTRLLEIAGVDVSALSESRRPTVLGGGHPVGELSCVL